jgi:hypothetical protein
MEVIEKVCKANKNVENSPCQPRHKIHKVILPKIEMVSRTVLPKSSGSKLPPSISQEAKNDLQYSQ